MLFFKTPHVLDLTRRLFSHLSTPFNDTHDRRKSGVRDDEIKIKIMKMVEMKDV